MTVDACMHFKTLLVNSINNLRTLRQTLQTERGVLEARDLEALAKITEEKSAILARVQQDIEARKQFLQQHELSTDEAGIMQFLHSLDPTRRAAFEKGWQQLKDIFEEVQQLNLVNGRIVNRSQQQLNQLLNLLRPRTPDASPTLYSASGAKGGGDLQRSFGKV